MVRFWAKKLGVAPSKLLIPLSYASGMGGICTLIGTPPNLLISGFYTDETGIPFDPTTVPDVDITLSAEDRPIGGLGIFLVRQIMDTVEYQRLDNKNILRLQKQL